MTPQESEHLLPCPATLQDDESVFTEIKVLAVKEPRLPVPPGAVSNIPTLARQILSLPNSLLGGGPRTPAPALDGSPAPAWHSPNVLRQNLERILNRQDRESPATSIPSSTD